MSLDNIFSLFGIENENNSNDNDTSSINFSDLKETPNFKLGMFKKLIFNGSTFKKQISQFLSKSDPELEVNEVGDVGDFMMFNRAYYWVQDCKVSKKIWKDGIKGYSDDELLCAVKMSINYFEGTEEFEKCAHLIKIQHLIEKYLDK